MKKAKTTTNFVCQECGYDSPSWLGKCPECGNWNSFKEFHQAKNAELQSRSGAGTQTSLKPQTLKDIVYEEKSRIQTEYAELNTVLGGGIVRGSAILMAGDSGGGESTLLLHLSLCLSQTRKKKLYASAEETAEKVKIRWM